MSDSKPQLARDGTMAVTAKEGKTYLEKNLTDWKKPHMTDHFREKQSQAARGRSKPKLSKHTTMKGTKKEGENFLEAKGKPDQDAFTRGQQKKIEEVTTEPKKTKGRKAVKRVSTIDKTMQEAKYVLDGSGLENAGEGRRTRSASRGEAAPPPMKKANTMVRTAKEGKAFLKRGRKPKANKDKEEKAAEEEKAEEEEEKSE